VKPSDVAATERQRSRAETTRDNYVSYIDVILWGLLSCVGIEGQPA